jgi:hypothetical protein
MTTRRGFSADPIDYQNERVILYYCLLAYRVDSRINLKMEKE